MLYKETSTEGRLSVPAQTRTVRDGAVPRPPRIPEPDWSNGNCYSTAGEFFPPDSMRGSHTLAWYNQHVWQCNNCPITNGCLEYAMNFEEYNNGHRSGIWGGTTPQQRDIIRPYWRRLKWLPR